MATFRFNKKADYVADRITEATSLINALVKGLEEEGFKIGAEEIDQFVTPVGPANTLGDGVGSYIRKIFNESVEARVGVFIPNSEKDNMWKPYSLILNRHLTTRVNLQYALLECGGIKFIRLENGLIAPVGKEEFIEKASTVELTQGQDEALTFLNEYAIRLNTGLSPMDYIITDENGFNAVDADKFVRDTRKN